MGSGKTESAITQMNEDLDSRYIFVTPYLSEVERIKNGCPARDFVDPQDYGRGKYVDFLRLLGEKRCIATTHALFKRCDPEMTQLIHDGHYKLIFDESFEAVKELSIGESDFNTLQELRLISIDADGYIDWISTDDKNVFAQKYKDIFTSGRVRRFNNTVFVWTFPIKVFEAFEEVIILTYLFDSQVHKYYFDIYGIEFEKIGTVVEDGHYRFSTEGKNPEYARLLKYQIHILNNKKINSIGDKSTALSVAWYQKNRGKDERISVRQLSKNLANVFGNIYNANSKTALWTTYKRYMDDVANGRWKKSYLQCAARATNEYRDRCHLAYCINPYLNPFMKRYFSSYGVEVKEDEYALSEMIQWVWRSAIRDGNEIWIYIPSSRMRRLFSNWLDELAKG
jgi:hypothetical protein|nr:MAG TPA: putative ATP-dependent RNA helicase [Caudoviricetes sp.]